MSNTYARRSTALQERPHTRRASSSVQLKRQLANMTYVQQLERLRPPAPMGLQMNGGSGGSKEAVKEAAAQGLEQPASMLPHLGTIQKCFGQHDIGNIQAHVGGAAAEANEAMGAKAYATGNHVAFETTPDLRTAAHEATHVVQQRAGVNLSGGVGEVGDAYEQQADEVSSLVVQGKDVGPILTQTKNGAPSLQTLVNVQCWTTRDIRRDRDEAFFESAEVAMRRPPNFVASQYLNGYRPVVYFDASWNVIPFGDVVVDVNGHRRIQAPGLNEEEWQYNLDPVTNDDLNVPSEQNLSSEQNTFRTFYDPTWADEPCTKNLSVEYGSAAYATTLGQVRAVEALGRAVDSSDYEVISQPQGSSSATQVSVSRSLSTSITTASESGAEYGSTRETSSSTSVGGGGELGAGGHEGALGGKISASLSHTWGEKETTAYQNSSSHSVASAEGQTCQIEVAFTIPAWFKGAFAVFPRTEKFKDTITSRHHRAGMIESSDAGLQELEIAYNVPTGWVAVFGIDPAWERLWFRELAQCRELYEQARRLEGDDSEEGRQTLIEVKLDLQDALIRLRSIPSDSEVAISDAIVRATGSTTEGIETGPIDDLNPNLLLVETMWTFASS